MINYIIRRFLYAVPLLMGVNILTFVLFFMVNSPDDMARMQLGMKHVTQEAVDNWKHQHGYDLPLLWNSRVDGAGKITETVFYQKSAGLFMFRFGVSDSGRNIGSDIKQRMWPSLALAVPTLIIGLLVNIGFALMMVLFRASYLELGGMVLCVILMSVSS
ncbi:MAG: ABC transporter permease, partial [Gammaproteobacteria bacterium]